jgi:hypothetical protein
MSWLVRHAMCALYPRTEALPGVADTDVDAFLARYKRETAPLVWLGVVLGALVFASTPMLTVFVPLPSFFLPSSLLDRHAMKITGTRIYLLRQSIFLVKLAAGMCWGMHPSVRTKLGMRPYPADPGTWRIG